jgi:hypothetical protein
VVGLVFILVLIVKRLADQAAHELNLAFTTVLEPERATDLLEPISSEVLEHGAQLLNRQIPPTRR